MEAIKTYAEELLRLRTWANDSLPAYGSSAAVDMMLYVIAHHRGASGSRLKDLYLSLPYSESNLRRYLRLMEKDGWVVLQADADDHRNHLVSPTPRLLAAFEDYALRAKRMADGVSEESLVEWLECIDLETPVTPGQPD